MVSGYGMELQTGEILVEILVEISVDDLRLRIWEIIWQWNWGVSHIVFTVHVIII